VASHSVSGLGDGTVTGIVSVCIGTEVGPQPETGVSALKQLHKSTRWWDPDRRRSGPRPERNFFRYIRGLKRIGGGAHFGADLQPIPLSDI
jgi:hypothetical protein